MRHIVYGNPKRLFSFQADGDSLARLGRPASSFSPHSSTGGFDPGFLSSMGELTMKLYVADAFTTQRFSGNQAGVAVLGTEPFPAEELMRALAGELKHSETAFVRQTGEKSFHILLLHPGGGGGSLRPRHHRLLHRPAGHRGHRAGDYALHTRSGDLTIQVGADSVWMDMAPPTDGRGFSEEEQAELYAAYGLSLADRPDGLEAQAVSTGLLDILLP